MFIKSLHLKNFKRFDKLDLDFPSDITIIKGPNEKGKSTIVEAFVAGLFYDPQKSNKDIEALKSWHSNKLYEIKLEFESNGEEYELLKDFGKKVESLINRNTGQLWEEHKEISEMLYQLGGYRNARLFENTALVKQASIQLIDAGKKEIDQALQDLVTSGQNNVSANDIIERLGDALGEIKRGLDRPVKNPGILKKIQDDLDAKNREKLERQEELKEIKRKKEELESLKENYKKITDSLDINQRQLDQNMIYFGSLKEQEKIEKDLEKASSDFKNLLEIEQQIEKTLINIKDLSQLERVNLKEIDRQSHEIEFKEKELEKVKRDLGAFASEGPKAQEYLRVLCGLGITILFLLGLGGFFFSPWLFLSWLCLVALLLWVLFAKINILRFSKRTLRAQEKGIRKEITSLRTSLTKKLTNLEVGSVEELEDKLENYNLLKKEKERLESKKEGISRERTLEELEKEKGTLERELAVERAKITDEQKASPPTPKDQRILEKEIEKLKKEKEESWKNISEIEAIIKHSKADEEDIIRVGEEIENLEEALRREKAKEKIYALTKDVLIQAKTKTIQGVRSRLEKYIQKFLYEITAKKYSKVKIDEDLGFKVFSPEKKEDVVPDESLSKGTIDQFYLVARFALLRLLSFPVKKDLQVKGGYSARPLIILDDPFYNFDKHRKAMTHEILKSLAKDFQIILLTHSDEYDSWGVVREI